jgi:hypothetical protein
MRVKLLIFLAVTVHCFYAQEMPDIKKHLDGITVYDIAGDGKDIWAATNGNGIYNYSKLKNKWSNYSTANNKIQMDFFYSIDANDEYVWAGSTDGLFILDKKRNRWTKRKFAKGGQLSNWIRSIKYDKYDDVVWIGRFKYLTKLDIKKRRFYDYDLTMNDDQKTNTIKVIALDGDSLVWFGTENGLHKYDKSRGINDSGTVDYYNNRLNYFHGEGEAISISSLLFEQNFVWIGLDEFKTSRNPLYNLGGLYRYDRRNEWLRFDQHNGLRANGIFDIERTGNYLWASCYQFGTETKDIYGRGIALVNIMSGDIILLDNEQIPDTVLKMYFDGTNMWLASVDGLYQIDLTNPLVNGIYN